MHSYGIHFFLSFCSLYRCSRYLPNAQSSYIQNPMHGCPSSRSFWFLYFIGFLYNMPFSFFLLSIGMAPLVIRQVLVLHCESSSILTPSFFAAMNTEHDVINKRIVKWIWIIAFSCFPLYYYNFGITLTTFPKMDSISNLITPNLLFILLLHIFFHT